MLKKKNLVPPTCSPGVQLQHAKGIGHNIIFGVYKIVSNQTDLLMFYKFYGYIYV